MNVLASLDSALPRVGQSCLRRSLSSSPPRAMPRFMPSAGKTSGPLPRGYPEPKTATVSARAAKEASAVAKASAGTVPPAWFIPKASSTAPVVRPSFLPPPPRTVHSAEDEVPPPPSSFPEHLHGLWTHLYTHPLLRADAVQFISTARPAPRTIPILNHPPRNGRRNRGFADSGSGVQGLDIGGWWDWQVVCVVQGRGRGDVRRGELSIREWVRVRLRPCRRSAADMLTEALCLCPVCLCPSL